MYLSEVEVGRRRRRPRFISPYLGETQEGGLPGFSVAEEKALRITTTFETGRPLNFSRLAGNFDGQGLSFGLLQWNIGTGSLQPLLLEFARDHPQRFDAIFGPHAAPLRQVLSQPREEQLRFARSINDARNRIVEPWASYFRRLGEAPAFQQIELRHVRPRLNVAANIARQIGLRNERGLALIFDNVTQNGPAWLQRADRAALIQQRRAEFQQRQGRPPQEREFLAIIANVVADTVKPEWRENVRRRRMTIVEGRGRVHGRDFDLEREFGLTDQPWETTTGAAPTTAPSPTPSPAPQSPNGSDAQLIQDALRQGVRDENQLTNLVFFARHPERRGQRLQPHERQLVQEWLDIRNRLVRPALAQTPPIQPVPTGGSAAQLATRILNNPRITLATIHVSGVNDNATARQNIMDTSNGLPASRSNYGNAPGGTVQLDDRLLEGILRLANRYSFAISEIAGGSHSPTSRHYAGIAIDVNVINGQRVNANHPDVPSFIQACRNLGATEVLGPGDPGHATHIHCAWPRR